MYSFKFSYPKKSSFTLIDLSYVYNALSVLLFKITLIFFLYLCHFVIFVYTHICVYLNMLPLYSIIFYSIEFPYQRSLILPISVTLRLIKNCIIIIIFVSKGKLSVFRNTSENGYSYVNFS